MWCGLESGQCNAHKTVYIRSDAQCTGLWVFACHVNMVIVTLIGSLDSVSTVLGVAGWWYVVWLRVRAAHR
jgi:predicted tellurium resistance membrane protein TerC